MTSPEHVPSGTLTVLFTDIEGYSTLESQYRDALHPPIETHNRLMREVAAQYGGIEVKTIGDAFCWCLRSRPPPSC
jgi:class 3 adenylate cyclase